MDFNSFARKAQSTLIVTPSLQLPIQKKDTKSFQSLVSCHKFTQDSIQMMLLSNTTKYTMNQSIKDAVKCFLEIELAELTNQNSYEQLNYHDVHTNASIVKNLMDKGSILALCYMKDGSIMGAFSLLGWLSSVDYVTDSQVCGIVIKDGAVNVFELGNKMVSYCPTVISFGRYGVDFTLHLSSLNESAIFRKCDILPMGLKLVIESQVDFIRVYNNVVKCPY